MAFPGGAASIMAGGVSRFEVLKQDWKRNVKVATTGPVVLNGPQVVDGALRAAGDEVLVKDQADAKQNGLYVIQAGAWTRRDDADESAKLTSGATVWVSEGAANIDTVWSLITDDPIVLGTTNLLWAKTGGAGAISGAGTANYIPKFTAPAVLANSIVYDDGAGHIGIGTASPLRTLHVSQYTPSAPGAMLDSYMGATGGGPGWILRRARGSSAVPSAVLTGDILGSLLVHPYGATQFSTPNAAGAMRFVASEDHTDAVRGTEITFAVTQNATGTLTERMRLANNGFLGIGEIFGTTPPAGFLEVINDLGSQYGEYFTRYSSADTDGSVVTVRMARGTAATPVALQASDTIGSVSFNAYNSAPGWAADANVEIRVIAAENQTGAAQGATFTIRTIAAGGTVQTEKLRLSSVGRLGLNVFPSATLEVQGEDSVATAGVAQFTNFSPTVSAVLVTRRARGTSAAPVAVQTNDTLGGIAARGYNGAAFSAAFNGFFVYAAENHTGIAQGTYAAIRLTPIGGVAPAEVLRITDAGAVGIGCVPAGGLLLDVDGAARIQGKLTVTGGIDPTFLELDAGVAVNAYIDLAAGQSAANPAASHGRIRYNATTNTVQIGANGGAFSDIVVAGYVPAGATTNILFNDGGALGADANFTWHKGTGSAQYFEILFGANQRFRVGTLDPYSRTRLQHSGPSSIFVLGMNASDGDPANIDSEGIAVWYPTGNYGARVKADRFGLTRSADSSLYYFRVDTSALFYRADPPAGTVWFKVDRATGAITLRGMAYTFPAADAAGVLTSNGAGVLSWGAGGVGAHNFLSASHTDTTPAAVARGDLITGQGAIATWSRLGIGAAETYLKSDGTDASWTALPQDIHTTASPTFAALNVATANGASAGLQTVSELVTIAAFAFSDSAANLLPASSWVLSVEFRVIVQPPGTATLSISTAEIPNLFAAGMSSAGGTTSSSFLRSPPLAPFVNESAKKVRITPDAVPSDATGRVRVTVHYVAVTPPAS